MTQSSTEARFPTPSDKTEKGFSVYYSRNDYGAFDFELESYQKAIMTWFKQCIEERPTHYQLMEEDTHAWFTKWFLQFQSSTLTRTNVEVRG